MIFFSKSQLSVEGSHVIGKKRNHLCSLPVFTVYFNDRLSPRQGQSGSWGNISAKDGQCPDDELVILTGRLIQAKKSYPG